MVTISCPECQQPVDLNADLKIGLQATCQSCNSDLVVTWLFPVCLDTTETKEQISTFYDLNPE